MAQRKLLRVRCVSLPVPGFRPSLPRLTYDLPVNVALTARDFVFSVASRAREVFSVRFSVFSFQRTGGMSAICMVCGGVDARARDARGVHAVQICPGGSDGTARSYTDCAPCTAQKTVALRRLGAGKREGEETMAKLSRGDFSLIRGWRRWRGYDGQARNSRAKRRQIQA
jgi:hypothetical protein